MTITIWKSGISEAAGHGLLPVQVTLDLKLELPQVAVVGSQSSGKSSVLEALVLARPLPCISTA